MVNVMVSLFVASGIKITMKKLIYLLSVTFLLLQSCSSGDDSNSGSSAILCKKMVEGTSVTDFTYDGNKMDRVMFNGQLVAKYYYTGDFITKHEIYRDNQLILINTYRYVNDKESTRIDVYLDGSITYRKTIYTYNSDDTVSFEEYSGTATEQNILNATGIITLLNGQVVKIEAHHGITLVTYDNKKSPWKNVTGFDKLIPTPNFVTQGNNNVVTIKYPNFPISTYYYQYNDQGYPIIMYTNSSNPPVNPVQYYY